VSNLPFDLQNLLATYSFGLPPESVLALAVLVFAIVLLVVALVRVDAGKSPTLRPIKAFSAMDDAITESTETGQAIHLSPGAGSVGDTSTAATLAGLTAVAALSERAATASVATITSTASPLALPLLQIASERGFAAAGAPEESDSAQLRFTSPDRSAYAVSVSDAVVHEGVSTSMVSGSLGDEVLIVGERAHDAGAKQVAGTDSALSLPVAVATADHLLLGEQIYAAGAYLGRQRSHVASLQAQDWLRLAIVAAIVAGVVIKTLGWL
jgi:hypothetical protein